MTESTVPINIAELIVAADPIVISTILGSCISVCLYSPEAKAGGMIHYALPEIPKNGTDDPLRYGDYAIPRLVEELKNLTGSSSANFIAKITGGADNIASEKTNHRIGKANVEIANSILKNLQIKIVGQDVGGYLGRKALFHIATGRLQTAPIGSRQEDKPIIQPIVQIQLPKKIVKPKTKDVSPVRKTRVLIVDDSKTIRDILARIFTQDPEFEVVGQAEDPFQAEALLTQVKPDVITLDIHMPGMTGVQWLEKLLPKNPIPVVMITSLQLQDGNEVFHALELGAVDYIAKPALKDLNLVSLVIRDKVKQASKATVRKSSSKVPRKTIHDKSAQFVHGTVLSIGASTGGTEALREVLTAMPPHIPPTLIVQHIPPVFSKAFADRLNDLCHFDVKEAADGDSVHDDRVLIAPGGKQMKLVRKNTGLFVEVTDDEPVNRHKPSVDYLFNSVASVVGKKAIGVILTGMGADGAKGLLNIRTSGGRTISQNESSCVVYGMPKAASDIGASEEVVDLNEIASRIVDLARTRKGA